MYISECKDVYLLVNSLQGGLQIENMLGPEKVSFLQRQLIRFKNVLSTVNYQFVKASSIICHLFRVIQL